MASVVPMWRYGLFWNDPSSAIRSEWNLGLSNLKFGWSVAEKTESSWELGIGVFFAGFPKKVPEKKQTSSQKRLLLFQLVSVQGRSNFYLLKRQQAEGLTTFTFPLAPFSNRRHLIAFPPPFRQFLNFLGIVIAARVWFNIWKLYSLPSNDLLKLNELRSIWSCPRTRLPLDMML